MADDFLGSSFELSSDGFLESIVEVSSEAGISLSADAASGSSGDSDSSDDSSTRRRRRRGPNDVIDPQDYRDIPPR